MKSIYINILSWLLYHANQNPSREFYEIKNRILTKYGKHICYDVQHFEGIKCDTCNGSGRFKCFWPLPEFCWSCSGTGWYKPESWVILARLRIGKYDCFHRPFNRVTERPELSNPMIEGYVEKTPTRYSHFALMVLFLSFEKGYLRRRWKELYGWRVKWWLPKNWVHNVAYIIKFGRTGRFPLWMNWRLRLDNLRLRFKKPVPVIDTDDNDDLPF